MVDRGAVLITGGTRGIGAATARLFAALGHALCLGYHSDDEAAARCVHELETGGVPVLAVKADIATEAGVMALFQAFDARFTRLAILVNNAAILHPQCRLEQLDAHTISRVLATNVTGSLLCAREAVKRMAFRYGGQGGVIINVSSGAAKSGSPGEYLDYAASKGAVDTFTRGLALEVAREGIRVNGVRPGMTHTDMHARGGEPGRVERLAAHVPLQRGARPEEVAEAIVWLASEPASYVTGSILDVTGGL